MNFIFNIIGFFVLLAALAYALVPSIFLVQLKHGVLKEERLSIIGILSFYMNALIYLVLSVSKLINEDILEINDFCNLLGATLGLVYIILYYNYFYYEKNKKLFYIFISIIIVSSIIIIPIELKFSKDQLLFEIFEWIGVFFNIFEYLPLGFNFIYLIKNKISDKYTLFGAFFGIINSIFWLIWAIINSIENENEKEKESKYHSIVANICGIILCLSQFIIFLIFRKPEEEEEEESKDNYKTIEDDNDVKIEINKNDVNNDADNSKNDNNNYDDLL